MIAVGEIEDGVAKMEVDGEVFRSFVGIGAASIDSKEPQGWSR